MYAYFLSGYPRLVGCQEKLKGLIINRAKGDFYFRLASWECISVSMSHEFTREEVGGLHAPKTGPLYRQIRLTAATSAPRADTRDFSNKCLDFSHLSSPRQLKSRFRDEGAKKINLYAFLIITLMRVSMSVRRRCHRLLHVDVVNFVAECESRLTNHSHPRVMYSYPESTLSIMISN